MLIFGYGPRPPKDHGPAVPARCASCRNEVVLHLVVQRRWVSLFFVPVIPGAASHALVCPVCSYAITLTGSHAAMAEELVADTQARSEDRLHEVDYQGKVNAFWTAVAGEAAARAQERGPEPEPWPSAAAPSAGPAAPGDAPPPTGPPGPDPAAGWYPDPFGVSEQRYWDGQRWTAGTNPPVFGAR